MHRFARIFASALFTAFSLVTMIIFRAVPATKLWAGYTVMSVPAETDAKLVIEGLEKCGCKAVICRAAQRVPLDLPQNSPEVSLAALGVGISDYLLRRNQFFFDKSGALELYYIPDEYGKNLKAAAASLNAEHSVNAALCCGGSYPLAAPFLALSFAFFLLFFSEERMLFAFFAFPPTLYAFCFPAYTSASAVCLLLCAAFFALSAWDRKNAVRLLLKSRDVIVLTAASCAVSAATGVRGAVFFMIAALSGLCALFLTGKARSFFERQYSFVPVKILSAGAISINAKNTRSALIGAAAASALLALFALPSVLDSSLVLRGGAPLFPAARARDGSFASLQDFTEWRWEALTYPYISVNAAGDEKNIRSVSFFRYENTGGLIAERQQTITFDAEFKKNALDSINALDFPAVEKLLKRQKTLSAGYASSSSQTVSVFTIIALALGGTAPLFLSVSRKIFAARESRPVYRTLQRPRNA